MLLAVCSHIFQIFYCSALLGICHNLRYREIDYFFMAVTWVHRGVMVWILNVMGVDVETYMYKLSRYKSIAMLAKAAMAAIDDVARQ